MAARYWRTKLAVTVVAAGILIGSVGLMAAEGIPGTTQPVVAGGAATGGSGAVVANGDAPSQPTRSNERQSRAS